MTMIPPTLLSVITITAVVTLLSGSALLGFGCGVLIILCTP